MDERDLETGDDRASRIAGAAASRTVQDTPRRSTSLAFGLGAAIVAPFLWVGSIFVIGPAAPHLLPPAVLMLVSTLPPALIIGYMAAKSDRPGIVAGCSVAGQAVVSLFLGTYVAMGLDGHSGAAARFSLLPFFAPVLVYPLAAATGIALDTAGFRLGRKRSSDPGE